MVRLSVLSVLVFAILATPAAAEDLYIMAVRDNGSVVVDRASAVREGPVVRFRMYTWLAMAQQSQGRELRWVETQSQIDCEAHRNRRRVIGGWDHHGEVIFLDATGQYGDWSQIEPGSPASVTEAFLCRDERGPEVKVLQSLYLFPFVALGKVHSRFYVNTRQDEEGWRAMDMATIDGGANLVGVTELVLMTRPQTRDGVTYHWVEAQTDYDCVGHRRRDRGIAAFTLDMSRRRGEGNAEFRPWRPNAPGTPAREAEDFLCRNTAAPTIRGFGDPGTLQKTLAPSLR